MAFDTAYPDQTSTVVLPVVVTRNEHAPIFEQYEYQTSIPENQRIGSSILLVKASDNDQVSKNLSCYAFSKQFFLVIV